MKKVLFAFPALAFTLFLTFCQKSNVQEEAATVNHGTGVTDRGPCTITISADNISSRFRICGINVNNQTACNTCAQVASNGVEQFQGSINFTLPNLPVTFSVRNISATGAWVEVATSGGAPVYQYVAPGGSLLGDCAEFTIDDQCVAH